MATFPWVKHDRLYSWKMKMKRSKKTEDQLSYLTGRSMNRSSIPKFYQAKALRRVDITPREEGEKIMMLDTNSDTRGIIIVFFFFFFFLYPVSSIHILRRTVFRIGRVTGHVTLSAGKLRVSLRKRQPSLFCQNGLINTPNSPPPLLFSISPASLSPWLPRSKLSMRRSVPTRFWTMSARPVRTSGFPIMKCFLENGQDAEKNSIPPQHIKSAAMD